MKNLFKLLMACLLFVVAAAIPAKTNAQLVSTVTAVSAKDTTVNTDTTSFLLNAENIVKSLSIKATVVTGSVNGKAYLQGTVNGTDYTTLDSCIFSSNLYKTFTLPSYTGNVLAYKTYRLYILGAGTNKQRYTVQQLRRSN